jgi:hypothetical protein
MQDSKPKQKMMIKIYVRYAALIVVAIAPVHNP